MYLFLSKKLLYCYIAILLIVSCFLFSNTGLAQNTILGIKESCDCKNITDSTPPECKSYCGGNYTLNEMFQTVINVAEWIWGIAGSLALLAFVYGGIMFLISGGSSEKVAKAKQIIIGATLGLIIVFTSYIIIGFIFTALDIPEAKNWATSGWFKR
jgi:hypothetical protein